MFYKQNNVGDFSTGKNNTGIFNMGTMINTGDNLIITGDDNKIYGDKTNKQSDFCNEIEQATNLVLNMKELELNSKNALIEIFKQAKEAKNEDEKEKNKVSFKYFMLGLGKTGEKIISFLANLSTLAEFFQIPRM